MILARVLAETERITVGPMVTNPGTRDWSVLASTFATLNDMYGPRTVCGMGAATPHCGTSASNRANSRRWPTPCDSSKRWSPVSPFSSTARRSAFPGCKRVGTCPCGVPATAPGRSTASGGMPMASFCSSRTRRFSSGLALPSAGRRSRRGAHRVRWRPAWRHRRMWATTCVFGTRFRLGDFKEAGAILGLRIRLDPGGNEHVLGQCAQRTRRLRVP